ncbi:MAG TPA: PEGA domain-containing protein [Chthoniobacterales bacterium]
MAEPDRFQHYQVLKHPDGRLWELGRGAMGVTYKAFDTSLRSEVALKVISAQYLNSETARQRFLREARAAAQLRHPNVATVFHLGDAGGTFFYAMEFVDGETLERRVQREGSLRVDVALRITRQVARALIAADRQRLVHRDIKPANIMLVRDDDEDHLLVKVIDFGLAKSLASAVDQSVTVTMGGFVGTPHFASPEQLEEREIDVRSDIYSLGASLWYMLTGKPPFHGSLASVIHQQLGQALPESVLAALPPRVAELLTRMLTKRPEDRIQTPAELKQQLDDLVAELRGLSPTLVLDAARPTAFASDSSIGFGTGQIIRGRYELLGHAPTDRTLFRARDLQTQKLVALRPLSALIQQDPAKLEFIRQEVQRVKGIHHPNVLQVHGLEQHDSGAMIASEWVDGFTLQELLRVRREVAWEETDCLMRPMAKLLDFLADRQLSFQAIQLRSILVEPTSLAGEAVSALLRQNVTTWPPYTVRLDPISLIALNEPGSAESAQTLVDLSTAEIAPRPVQQLARLTYELLGGVHSPSSGTAGGLRFTPLSALAELGNNVLRQGLTDSGKFASALDFLSDLADAQRGAKLPARIAPVKPGPVATAAGAAAAPVGPARFPPGDTAAVPVNLDDTATPSSPATGRLLQFVIGAIALLLAAAIGALVVTNWKQPKPAEPAMVAHEGKVTLDTKPEGAIVRLNGAEIGRTPLTAAVIPSGKQTLQLSLPGYQPRPLEVQVNDGVLNNVGVVALAHEIGHVTIQSDPSGATFELVDADQKTTTGMTPATLDGLPTGHYSVRLHQTGFQDYTQELEVAPGNDITVQRNFRATNVLLRSDPSGATIYMAERELGKTPLAVNLPPEGAELVSRIGALAPVTQSVKPGAEGSTVVEFKHDYGILVVSSDRPNAEVNIGGVNMGKVPVQGIVPPGSHQVTVHADGAKEQTRMADVGRGARVNLAFNFEANPADLAAQGVSVLPAEAGGATTPLPKASPRPTALPRPRPRAESTPVYRSAEDFEQARKQAYRRFDADWEARKQTLEQEKDYYDYQEDHSNGETKDRWKYKKEVVKQRLDQLDDAKDAAKRELKRRWNDD